MRFTQKGTAQPLCYRSLGVFCNQSLNEKSFNPRLLVSSLSGMLCQNASYSIPVVLSVFSLNCKPGGETEGTP